MTRGIEPRVAVRDYDALIRWELECALEIAADRECVRDQEVA